MNIALTKHFEQLIARLISTGRYNNAGEVVRSALRKLEAQESSMGVDTFPAGSLRHLYKNADNQAEIRTIRG